MMGDIMYFDQALWQPDAGEFVKALVEEVNGHIENKWWKLVKWPDVDVILPVWSMRCKHNLTTNEITKYKSTLNLHDGKQVYGMNYFDTYVPVVTWFAIRIVNTIFILFELSLHQIDFVQAYPQAPIETDMYMELPKDIETCHGNSKDHVLMIFSNLYGQKQAEHVWNSFLEENFSVLVFIVMMLYIVYVDDGIFLGPDDGKLTNVITEMTKTGLDIEDQGHPADYAGVIIT